MISKDLRKIAFNIAKTKDIFSLSFHEILALMGVIFEDCDIVCKSTIPIKIMELMGNNIDQVKIREFLRLKLKTIRMKKLGFTEFRPSNKVALLKVMIADSRCMETNINGIVRMKLYQFSEKLWTKEFENIQKTGCYDVTCSICGGRRLVEDFAVVYSVIQKVKTYMGENVFKEIMERVIEINEIDKKIEEIKEEKSLLSTRIPINNSLIQELIERVVSDFS